MINLYIFNQTSHAAVFGIGTYIRELITSLKNSDINVYVVHLHSEKTNMETEDKDGIQHWYIPSLINKHTSIDWNIRNKMYYRNVVYLLRLKLRETDKLVFQLNYNYCIELAKELRATFNCKIVSVIHSFGWCFDLFGNVTRFKKIISSIQGTNHEDKLDMQIYNSYKEEKDYFELVDRIYCLSKNTQQIVHDDYQIKRNKTIVIYNGLTDIYPISNKTIIRQKYHIPHIPIILFAGRIESNKGLKYALQAFRIVLKTCPDCRFIIAGNGEFDVHLKECEDIWAYIIWTGLISKKKLYDLYSIADIGVIPSFNEQCSYVAIEMMMHGIPLIASNSTGLNEMVEDKVTGLHIPIMEYYDRVEIDTNLLAEKMLYLLEHPTEAKRLGKNARKRYEERYSSEVFRKNILNFYHSLYE